MICDKCNVDVEEFKDLYDDRMVFCPECKGLWMYR
jgi:Zn-finger nucleic acid-binding protein